MQYLLEILELGYSVLYNDVDMVWLANPFSYFKNKRGVYITDDMLMVRMCDFFRIPCGLCEGWIWDMKEGRQSLFVKE